MKTRNNAVTHDEDRPEDFEMLRKAVAMMLLAGLGGGCMTANPTKQNARPFNQVGSASKTVPGISGPRGEPVAIGYNNKAVMPYGQARVNGMTGDVMQAKAKTAADAGNSKSGIVQASFNNPNPNMTGFAGPIAPPVPPMGPPGAVAAVGAMPQGGPMQIGNARTSVFFAEPVGMRVSWLTGGFGEHVLEMPGRYNFLQGGIYRLKLSNIPALPNKDLYPTIEVLPATQKSATFLAHSSVPITFTEEDFEQVASGNFLVKVIYLPDPAFQDIAALAGPNEIVSTRLEPGVDPVIEAQKRGTVLMIVRVGNSDLQAPNTPAMDAPPGGGMIGPGGPIQGNGPIPGIPIVPNTGEFQGGPIQGNGPIPGIPIVPNTGAAPIQSQPLIPKANGPVGMDSPPPLPARFNTASRVGQR